MIALLIVGWLLAGLAWGIVGSIWWLGRLGMFGGDTIPGSTLPLRSPPTNRSVPSPTYDRATIERGMQDLMEQAAAEGRFLSQEDARIEALELLTGLKE